MHLSLFFSAKTTSDSWIDGRAAMRSSWVSVGSATALLLSLRTVVADSPPISANIVANWLAPSFAVQYLSVHTAEPCLSVHNR